MTKQLIDVPKYQAALEAGMAHLLRQQSDEGYWWAPLLSNVTMEAEYVLLAHCLGKRDRRREQQIVRHLFHLQREDGTWAIFTDGPSDLSATVEAYVALKLMGVSEADPRMCCAKVFIQSEGGVYSTRVFTRLWLALVGEVPWERLPVIPPEIMYLGKQIPLNIYDFASWARPTIVGLTIVMTHRPVYPLPDEAKVPELFDTDIPPHPPHAKGGNSSFFLWLDKALKVYHRFPFHPGRKRAEQKAVLWLIERQARDGSVGGIQPPWFYMLLALKVLDMTDHPAFQKGWDGLEHYGHETEEGGWLFQASISPTWDTGLSILALRAGGLEPDHPALIKAGEWLMDRQIFVDGDWKVRREKTKPGGWAFQFHNDYYPDIDDTAIVVMALNSLQGQNEHRRQAALTAGFNWLRDMQSSNGGFGAYDVDNDSKLANRIPFCDFGEVVDPPSVDVTAHVLECFANFGCTNDWQVIRRGVDYIRREQQPNGAFFGRWGVNYTWGTGAVVPALKAIGADVRAPWIQKSLDWIEETQNEDGGWGEDCLTYVRPELGNQGFSTPSQSAWALMALIAGGRVHHDSVSRGVGYLYATQQPDGSWNEDKYTGTGFPRDFYLAYTLYRNIFPVMALGRYREAIEQQTR